MLNWVVENWEAIFSVIGIASTAATAIVAAFSKCKWASWIVKVCDYLSVVNTAKNKEIIANYASKKKAK